MSSSTSFWSSITSFLSTTPSTSGEPPPPQEPPPLQEVLLANKGPAGTSRREAIRQLRDRADALRRELQAAADQTEAAEAATRHAERRASEAAAELEAVTRTSQTHDEKLLEMEVELKDRDARIKLLEAIVATLTIKK
ncbi:hypothetical protein QOZ80_1AG0001540 [Eleusine coracana subsp. coracana]|nr:hypothetical protein QOZ80_1AG0001540 [Eleusine coracana subsp. coracana]